jgi:hypothetical protein
MFLSRLAARFTYKYQVAPIEEEEDNESASEPMLEASYEIKSSGSSKSVPKATAEVSAD